MAYNKITLYDNQNVDYMTVLNHTVNQGEINQINNPDFAPDWHNLPGIKMFFPFNEDLVSSYVSGLISPLVGYSVYRFKTGDSVLQKVADVDRNQLYVIDYLVANNTEYIWTIMPKTDDELGVSMTSAPLTTRWYSWSVTSLNEMSPNVYLADESWLFKMGLGEPIESSEITQNMDITQFKTLSRFPKVSVGLSNYLSGSIACLFGDIDCISHEYDEPSEKFLAWRDFIGKGKPCLIKDIKGNALICNIVEHSFKYDNFINGIPTTIRFSYTQIKSENNTLIYSQEG